MNTNTIVAPSFVATHTAEAVPTTMTVRVGDHDVREIAIGFGRQPQSGEQLVMSQRMRQSREERGSFTASTISGVTFRRTDPLREPLRVADDRLQQHLEALCETLRAKY